MAYVARYGSDDGTARHRVVTGSAFHCLKALSTRHLLIESAEAMQLQLEWYLPCRARMHKARNGLRESERWRTVFFVSLCYVKSLTRLRGGVKK
jgi:hypothetical protein